MFLPKAYKFDPCCSAFWSNNKAHHFAFPLPIDYHCSRIGTAVGNIFHNVIGGRRIFPLPLKLSMNGDGLDLHETIGLPHVYSISSYVDGVRMGPRG